MVIFCLLLFVPLLSLLCLPFWKAQIKAVGIVTENIVSKGDSCEFSIQITNNSIFPVMNGNLTIRYGLKPHGTEEEREVSFSLDARDSRKILQEFSCPHCGILHVSTGKIKIYDFFRLFSVKIPVKISETAMIFPKYEYGEEENLDEWIQEEISTDVYSESNHEIKDIREYRQGDSPKKIHWKISSKRRQLMVKEYTSEWCQKEMFTFALLHEGEGKLDFQWYDRKMEELAGTCYTMLMQDRPHEVVWYRPEEQYFETMEINQLEDIGFLLEKVMGAGVGNMTEDYEEQLKDYLLSHRGQK